MGKKKRLTMEGLGGRRRISDALKKMIEDAGVVDQATLRLRSHPEMLARWRGYCGVETDAEIDYDNPEVFIEWWACDPSIYNLVDTPEEFISKTGCDADTFYRLYDPRVEGARFDNAAGRKAEYNRQVRKQLTSLRHSKG